MILDSSMQYIKRSDQSWILTMLRRNGDAVFDDKFIEMKATLFEVTSPKAHNLEMLPTNRREFRFKLLESFIISYRKSNYLQLIQPTHITKNDEVFGSMIY